MKYLFAASLSAFCLAAICQPPCGAATPANDGLIGYWSFDEGAGTTVADRSGNGNHGALRGNATWTDGVRGKAIRFDGSATVDCGNGPTLNATGALSLEAWMNPDEWVPGTFHGVTAKLPTAAPYTGWALYYAGYNDLFQALVSIGGVDTRIAFVPPEPHQWHHVAFTYDGTRLRLYLDGVAVASAAVKGPIAVNNERLVIGQMYSSSPRSGFKGVIDEVRLYNRALSGKEIAEHCKVFGKKTEGEPRIRVTDYPPSLYVKDIPERQVKAPLVHSARSVTWGTWGWTPSARIIATFEPSRAETIAKGYAASGANVVFIDEHRYILVDEDQFQGYLDRMSKAVAACHKHGLKVVLHLTVDGVLENYSKAHPEQSAIDMETKKGASYEPYGTHQMCPNNPGFQKAYLDRVDALMKTGLDGLMPDETEWLPPKTTICGCRYCREQFKTSYGYDPPDIADRKMWDNFDDPRWRAWIHFRIKSQGNMLVKIKEVVDRYGAETIMTGCQCNLLSPWHGRSYGMDLEDMSRGLGASFFECEPGNPWSWRYNVAEAKYYAAVGPSFFLEYSHSRSQQYFSWAFALTNGLRLWTWPELEGLRTFPFLWEKKWESLFIRPVPLCNVAILFSSPSMNLVALASADVSHREYVGWAESFTESHVPFETLLASRMTAQGLRKYAIVVAPDMTCLSAGEVTLLRNFVDNGGTLVATLQSSLHDETGARRTDFALADTLGVSLRGTVAQVSLEFTDPRSPGRKLQYRGPLAKVSAAAGTTVLATSGDGMPLMTSHPSGKGRAIYVAFAPGTQYFMPKVTGSLDGRLGLGGVWMDNRRPEHKAIMLSVLDGTTLPFRAEAPEGVIVHPFVHEYREYCGIAVHLLNATGTDFKRYVAVPQEASYEFLDYPSPGTISLTVPAKDIRRAYLVSPDFNEVVSLSLTTKAGRCTVRVPSLARYAVVYFVQSGKDAVRDALGATPLVDRMPEACRFPSGEVPAEGIGMR